MGSGGPLHKAWKHATLRTLWGGEEGRGLENKCTVHAAAMLQWLQLAVGSVPRVDTTTLCRVGWWGW
jgi:hypothetical protein